MYRRRNRLVHGLVTMPENTPLSADIVCPLSGPKLQKKLTDMQTRQWRMPGDGDHRSSSTFSLRLPGISVASVFASSPCRSVSRNSVSKSAHTFYRPDSALFSSSVVKLCTNLYLLPKLHKQHTSKNTLKHRLTLNSLKCHQH